VTRLTGRRAVVTGGSRGIGRAIATAFAEAGAEVAIVARGVEALEAAAAAIARDGRRVVALACDVTNHRQVADLPARVRSTLGDPDILVNNAGGADTHKLVDHPDELWERMLRLNLTSVYWVTKALLPSLVASGRGRLINVASTAAKSGARYAAAYAAAKHGVLGLTRSLALELATASVTVNAVCPGYADTPMTAESIDRIVARSGRSADDARRALESTSPQARLIRAEEVAALVCFLAGDAAAGITGQAINVDGGAVMT
jgi:NAD(P)-dependent dehydrogenase (short-subunit alcohol dehydrogenase family)